MIVGSHKKLSASGKLALGAGDDGDRAAGVFGLCLVPAAADSTAILYKDGAATAGLEVISLKAAANATAEQWWSSYPIGSLKGWYVAITGTGAVVHVFHT